MISPVSRLQQLSGSNNFSMKKIYSILFFCVLLTFTCAQNKKYLIEELSLPDPVNSISYSGYNRIRLQDLRTDPDDFGIVKKGLSDRKAKVKFSPSLEDQLSQMFDKGISKSTAKDQELLFQLRDMNYLEVTIDIVQYGYFKYRGVLFGGKENQYQLLKKIDTTLVVFELDVTKQLKEQSLDYIRKTIFDAASSKPVDNRIYTIEDISNFDKIAKSQMPLYVNSKLTDGIYRNYSSFTQQIPDKPINEIEVNLGMINKVNYLDDNGKKKNAKSDSYAVIYQGKPYVLFEDVFYPMRKATDDYYFIARLNTKPIGEIQLTGTLIGGILGGAVGGLIAKGQTKLYEWQLDYFNGKYQIIREIKPQK